MAFLPPISNETGLPSSAHCIAIILPTALEPVNEIRWMSGSSMIVEPTSAPSPKTRLTTPGGRPASSSVLTRLYALFGENWDGLKTTVLPVTIAGMIFHDGIAIGKFHGVTQPTTPTGARTDMANLSGSSDGVVWPNVRRPSPAM